MKIAAALLAVATANASVAAVASTQAFAVTQAQTGAYSPYVEGFIKQLSLQLEADVKGMRACADAGELIDEHIHFAIEEVKSGDIVKIVHSLQTLVDIYTKDFPATIQTCTTIDMPEETKAILTRVSDAIIHEPKRATKMLTKNVKENALPLISSVTSLLSSKKAGKDYEAGKAAADVLVNILVGPGTETETAVMSQEEFELQATPYKIGFSEAATELLDLDPEEVQACLDAQDYADEKYREALEHLMSRDIILIVQGMQEIVDFYVNVSPASSRTCQSIRMSDFDRTVIQRVQMGLFNDPKHVIQMLTENFKANYLRIIANGAQYMDAKNNNDMHLAGHYAAHTLYHVMFGPGTTYDLDPKTLMIAESEELRF